MVGLMELQDEVMCPSSDIFQQAFSELLGVFFCLHGVAAALLINDTDTETHSHLHFCTCVAPSAWCSVEPTQTPRLNVERLNFLKLFLCTNAFPV